MTDMFDHQRAYQTCKGALAYFDIDPSFAEAEALQLRELADVVGLYPGVRDYACVTGGTYCVPGDDAAEWHQQATQTYPDTRSCWKEGQPSCYKPVHKYFSVATLDERARRIADAIATWRGNSTARASPLPPPDKVNGTQAWSVAQLELPASLSSDWERVPDPSQPASGHMVLQSVPNATAPLTIYTPGTVYDIASVAACTDSSKCGGGAPVAKDDVYLELEMYADNSWSWVRVCRQYLQSVRSAVVVTAPQAKQVQLRGVRYVSAMAEKKLRRWSGLDTQMWITGRGWRRTKAGNPSFDPANSVTKEMSFTAAQIALPGMPLVSTTKATHMEMCVEIKMGDEIEDSGATSAEVQFQPIGNDPRNYRNGGGRLSVTKSGYYRVLGQFCFSATGQCMGRYGPNWRVAIYPTPGSAKFTLNSIVLVDEDAPCPNAAPPAPPSPLSPSDPPAMIVGTSDHLLFDDH
jgi:hypothetical protein